MKAWYFWIFFTWCYCKVWMDMDGYGCLWETSASPYCSNASGCNFVIVLETAYLVLYQVFPEYPRDHLLRDSIFVIWTRQALVFLWSKLAQVWEIPWIMWYIVMTWKLHETSSACQEDTRNDRITIVHIMTAHPAALKTPAECMAKLMNACDDFVSKCQNQKDQQTNGPVWSYPPARSIQNTRSQYAGFLKWGFPKSQWVSILKWSGDLDDLGYTYALRNHQIPTTGPVLRDRWATLRSCREDSVLRLVFKAFMVTSSTLKSAFDDVCDSWEMLTYGTKMCKRWTFKHLKDANNLLISDQNIKISLGMSGSSNI